MTNTHAIVAAAAVKCAGRVRACGGDPDESTMAPIRKKIGQASTDGRWRSTVHGRGDSPSDLLGYRLAHDPFPADGAVGSCARNAYVS
jgi:hypothetical protein